MAREVAVTLIASWLGYTTFELPRKLRDFDTEFMTHIVSS